LVLKTVFHISDKQVTSTSGLTWDRCKKISSDILCEEVYVYNDGPYTFLFINFAILQLKKEKSL